jgi:hypothetical protein
MAMSDTSHIVKINVFMICIFIINILIYHSKIGFTFLINVFSQLNDLVYIYIYELW